MLRLATGPRPGADVRGIERLLTQVQWRDRELGTERPEAVNALVAVGRGRSSTRRGGCGSSAIGGAAARRIFRATGVDRHARHAARRV